MQKNLFDLKTYKIEEYMLLIFLLAIVLSQFFSISKLEHIAGPPYGGDLYRERGFTQHIINTNEIFSDPYFLDEYAFYPTLGYTLGAYISGPFGLDLDKVLIYLSFIFTAFTLYFLLKLGTLIFDDRTFAMILPACYFVFSSFFVLKHTITLGTLFLVVFLYYFIKLHDEKTDKEGLFSKDKLIAGIALGLIALSHYVSLIITIIFIVSVVCFEFIFAIAVKKRPLQKTIISVLKRYSVFIIIGIIISMIFFFPIIAKYHLHTQNPSNEYGYTDVKLLGPFWVLKTFFGKFFTLKSFNSVVFGILTAIGVIFTLLNIKNNRYRLVLFMFFGAALVSGHHLLTRPIFDFWIIPRHIIRSYAIPCLLLGSFGLRMIYLTLKQSTNNRMLKRYFFITLFILLSIGLFLQVKTFNSNRWIQYGQTQDASVQVFYDIGDWIIENSEDDEVILANDESAFMINAMSGRKLVFVRRTHASPYLDIEKRYADGVAMLYCKDPVIVSELIEEYGVKYLYLDQYLLQADMIVSKDHAKLLDDCGIDYSIAKVRLDPAAADAATYESLVVSPQELTIINISTQTRNFYVSGNLYSSMYLVGYIQSGDADKYRS